MSMDSARTVWAEDSNLDADTVEALTEIAEEARARGLEVDLGPRDVFSGWPIELELVGADDLAERVREIDAHRP